MPFRLSQLKEYDSFVVLDIGAYKVRVLIAERCDGELHVLARHSVRQSRKDIDGGSIADLYGVAKTVDRAMERACDDAGVTPDHIVCSIGSESILSDTLSTNYVRDVPDEKITFDEIDSVVSRFEKKSLERIRAKIPARLGIAASEMKLVATTLTSIMIDGRSVSNPVGMTGSNVKLGFLNAFVPLSEYSSYRSIAKHLGKELVSLVPVGIALPKILESDDIAYDPNCFVDLGAYRTTVTVTRENRIVGTETLPFGFSLLSDLLAIATSLGHIERDHMIAHPETIREESHKRLFSDFYEILCEGIILAVHEIVQKPYLRNIFLSGLPAENPDVVRRLAESLPRAFMTTSDCVRVCPVSRAEYRSENHVIESLALMGFEISSYRHDPIAGILRSIIYRYE
ncbi:MAG TPA: cell division protein FtsA [bacterium]|nr:cell division protein FtsA [bacterium]